MPFVNQLNRIIYPQWDSPGWQSRALVFLVKGNFRVNCFSPLLAQLNSCFLRNETAWGLARHYQPI